MTSIPLHAAGTVSRRRPLTRGRSTLSAKIIKVLVAAIAALTFLNPMLLYIQNRGYSGVGFGSFLAPIIILISMPRMMNVLPRRPRLWIVALLPVCLLPGTLHSGVSLTRMLSFLALWTGYAGVALAIAAWAPRIDFARVVFRAVCPTLLLLLGLSLVKLYAHLPIPLLNDLATYSIGFETDDARFVEGALGPFLDRTQAGMLLEGITAFLLAYIGYTRNKTERIVGVATVVTTVVFMVHTSNRSYFVSLGAAGLALILSISWTSAAAWKRWVPILCAICIVGLFGMWKVRAQLIFYANNMVAPLLAGSPTESGSIRLGLWRSARDHFSFLGWGPLDVPVPLEFLGEGDPIGSRGDTHSNFVFFFWRGGLLGIVWFSTFIMTALRSLKQAWTVNRSKAMTFFMPVMASMFVGGMLHTTLGNQLLWVFVGVFFGSVYTVRRHRREIVPH